MIRARTTLCLFALTSLALPPACEKKGKDKDETEVPDDGAKHVEIDTSVPQEPDPPQIAAAAQSYLQGQYDEVVQTLEPLYADLKSRNQYRASGLAGAWLALAHSKQVFENGKEPAEWAASMAEGTKDPDVQAAAKLAEGAVKIGAEDFASAEASLEGATQGKDRIVTALAHILRAEAAIGAAFGGGDSETVQDPAKFGTAKQHYDQAAQAAKGQAGEKLLLGRVEEGYAALADYQNKREEVCPHAVAAIGMFQEGGATRLLEGPVKLATDAKCEIPAGAVPADAG